MAVATFGAGCFWGVEETFREIPGVTDTAVGYMGGRTANPTYEEVCTDTTGHAEVVQVTYNPDEVSYEELLKVFWENHNPTTLNQQGPDFGEQYRSVVFYHDEEQKELAEVTRKQVDESGKWKNPVVTQVVPAEPFNRGEEYHQRYFQKRGIKSCGI